jgi:aconitate decarboxylase
MTPMPTISGQGEEGTVKPTTKERRSQVSPTYVERMAEWVIKLDHDQLTESADARLKAAMLDGIGAALYGSSLPWSRMLAESAESWSSTGRVTAWGRSNRLPLLEAALVNGAAVHAFELDDYCETASLHGASTALAAAASVAEQYGPVSGKELLVALAAGWEMGARLSRCMGPGLLARGWHSPTIAGTLAAAAAAGKALSLTEDQMANCLSLGIAQAGGLLSVQYDGMAKRYYAGRAAQSGLMAAVLAKSGYEAPRHVIEHPVGGFCSTFADEGDYSLEELVPSAGDRLAAEDIAFKLYSCCASIHTSLDLIHEIRTEVEGFVPGAVAEISVGLGKASYAHVGWPYEPGDTATAQFNLPYSVAVLLLEGGAFVDQYRADLLSDPRVLGLAARVNCNWDPAIDVRGMRSRNAAKLVVRLHDGTVIERARDVARGGSTAPASPHELEQKFMTLALTTVPDHQALAILHQLRTLDELPDVRSLFSNAGLEGGPRLIGVVDGTEG